MKRLLPLLFGFLLAAPAFSQGLLWEKRMGWYAQDELTDVVAANDSTFIACGLRYSYGRHSGGARDSDVCLVKFDAHGDTLWIKSIGMDGEMPRLCEGDGNTFYMAFTASWNAGFDMLNVLRIDYDGNVLDQWTIPGTGDNPYTRNMIRAQDGTLLLVGDRPKPLGASGISDMFVIRLEPTQGFTWFSSRFSDDSYTMGGWIEETPDGTYLASGMAGSHIWAVEIDSNGNEIGRQTLYQTPTRAVLDETSAVQQTPNGGYIVSGKPISYSPDFYYLGYHSGFSSTSQVWGGEHVDAETLTPHVQADGSILFYNYHGGHGFLSRIRPDSGSIWDVQFISQISTVDFPRLAALSYIGDSTAIGVGKMYVTGPGSHTFDLYFCRIQNVGLAYNPGQPVATKKRQTLPGLIAYPNPSTGSLTVHTRSKQPLRLYDLSGKQMLEAEPNASGTTQLDITRLPPGLYALRQGEAIVKVGREQ